MKLKSCSNRKRRVAYFSMEIGLSNDIPTYSGGLGILSGDTIKSFADLNLPVVAVTLLSEKGYFYQKLDEEGRQIQESVCWNPPEHMELLPEKISVQVEDRKVFIQTWQYNVVGLDKFIVPVLFLDSNLDVNNEKDRLLTSYLYGGDRNYRISQEIILGIGGIRMLKKLGYNEIERYHMNEGHSSFLALELLKKYKEKKEAEGEPGDLWDIEAARNVCVFTTHTPVPAGHDQFSYELVKEVLGEFVPWYILKKIAGKNCLNMTLLALNLSKYINGVAKKHGEVSKKMFPGYPIDSITNGIHSATWTSKSFATIFDKYIPCWRQDPFALRYSLGIPGEEIWQAHMEAKRELIDYVNNRTNAGMTYDCLTIGFARRTTGYKRAELIFSNPERLAKISETNGTIQLIFAGKAHPGDLKGIEIIKSIFKHIKELRNSVKIVYLPNYNIKLAKLITSGVDVWLNTPRRPMEASGTSGMKAVHNGIPNFSVLDGWWIEGHVEGITGWSIGPLKIQAGIDEDERDSQELYEKLENEIIPLFYSNREKWINIMQHCIAINASFFNTHRMVQEYILNAYYI